MLSHPNKALIFEACYAICKFLQTSFLDVPINRQAPPESYFFSKTIRIRIEIILRKVIIY